MYRFLATGEDTDGKYGLWEAIVPPGGGPPPHVHSREEEGFYVLESEITLTINGEQIVATAGMLANMPVGTPHSFKNENSKTARMLISVAPAGQETMFFEFGVPLPEGATNALHLTKEKIEKLLAIAPKYGIEIQLPGHWHLAGSLWALADHPEPVGCVHHGKQGRHQSASIPFVVLAVVIP